MHVFYRFLAVLSLCFLIGNAIHAQGFGRFGRRNDDGLLTLNVTEDYFETPPGAGAIRVWHAGMPLDDVPFMETSPTTPTPPLRITPTEKILQRTLDCAHRGHTHIRPAIYRVRHSLLYPGIQLESDEEPYVLRFTDRDNKPIPLKLDWLISNDGENGEKRSLLIRRADIPAPPFLAFVDSYRRSGNALIFPDDPVHGRPAEEIGDWATRKIGPLRLVTLRGVRDVPPGTAKETFQAEAQRWGDIVFPVRTGFQGVLAADGKSVTVTETFAGDIAPLPPLLSFALANGYPAKVAGKIIASPVLTKWGMYSYLRGNVLRYTLPIPPTEPRIYAAAKNADPARVALLNDRVGHLGGAWATNGVDLAYAGMTNAALATPYLSAQKRAEVTAAWKKYLPKAFTLPGTAWNRATEPFTGQSYLWTYKIDGPGGYNYDIDWGNALTLYGLYSYVRYTGEGKFVKTHWGDVQRIFRYFDLGDDWAWMTTVNTDYGYSTGTGDPLCAYYAGTIACLNMARAVGDKDAERKFAVRAARVALPTVARFWYTPWARKQGLIGPKDVVMGYSEKEGFTAATLGESDPWDATTLLSADGCLPELFALYRKYVRPAVRAFEDEYARAYPHWDDGDYKYPFETTYNGNSVYVVFPHLYARALILDEPPAALWKSVDRAQRNRNNAWIAPNVLAELLSRR